MTRVNPTAGIGDRGLHKALGGRLEIDGYAAAWRRELDRIADEIPENLFQFIAVPLDRWKPFRMHDLECNRFLSRDGEQTVGDQEGRGFDADRCEAEYFLFAVKAGPIEQLIDDSGEPIQVMSDASEIGQLLFAHRPCNAIAHIVCKAANHGHGGAQLMRGDREKPRSPPIVFLKALIGGGQFLRALCNTLFEVLCEFFEVGIGSGIVDGRGYVAGDRQQHVEIFFRAGLCAPVGGEVPEHLVVTLERHRDERCHPGAASHVQ